MSAPTEQPAGTTRPDDLSLVVIALFKGPVYRDEQDVLWDALVRNRRRVADHVSVLGLRVEVDETDGFAYLRSLGEGESEIEYPRLLNRHTLSFTTSLLVVLLRKRLLEFDTSSSDVRLVMSREQIVELMSVYAPSAQDEVRFGRDLDRHIKRVEELGFIRRLRGPVDQFEVRRIIRAFVDAQWLSDFDARLGDYITQLGGPDAGGPDAGGPDAALPIESGGTP